MLTLISCLFVTYFDESFLSGSLEEWSIAHASKNYSIEKCWASHSKLKHHCLVLSESNDKISLISKLSKQINSLPFLVYFTTRSTIPSQCSTVSLTALNDGNSLFSIGYNFNEFPEYMFNGSQNNILSNGYLKRDIKITHSIATIIRENNKFELYADGMILGNGTLKNPLPINEIKLDIENSNGTIEVGNIVITNDLKKRWPLLINTLLRFRDIERKRILNDLVNDYENKLFDGVPLNDEFNSKKEDGVLLSEEECDPRRFSFPFKLQKNDDDELLSNQKNDDEDEVEDSEGSEEL